MEKSIKKSIYLCIIESLCCIAEINTTLQINYISIEKYINKKIGWSGVQKSYLLDNNLNGKPRELPGGPVVRTLHFHCQGLGLYSWAGN